MKKMNHLFMSLSATVIAVVLLCSANPTDSKPLTIRVVCFKKCVEESKLGKQEQANFETLKKQMETTLAEKEKTLTDIATKFNDPDYLDSLSPEAETDLKRKFRAMSQELTQQQNQFYQTLSQTNMQVVQKLSENVAKASEQIAKTEKIDLILNEENAFYYSPDIDISSKVVAIMDQMADKEAKTAK